MTSSHASLRTATPGVCDSARTTPSQTRTEQDEPAVDAHEREEDAVRRLAAGLGHAEEPGARTA